MAPRARAGSRKKPPTRWGDRDGRRRDILDAARTILERDGYEALTMREVAKGAGVTPGLLYSYVADKEELFALLYAERLDRFHADIAPLCECESAEELFVAIAEKYLEVYRAYGRALDVWALVLDPGTARSGLARPLIASAAATLKTVAEAIDRFTPPGADRRLAVPLLWATLQGLCAQFTGARHQMHPYRWEELTRFAARTLVRGLGGT
jgi:AcrR family transcriptional regulator